jgi:hypothetical protein
VQCQAGYDFIYVGNRHEANLEDALIGRNAVPQGL